MNRIKMLERAGQAMFGPQWQVATARVLGAYHPSGPRGPVDDRLVRRWAAGQRPIPDWVMAALVVALRERGAQAVQLADEIEAGALTGQSDPLDHARLDRIYAEWQADPRGKRFGEHLITNGIIPMLDIGPANTDDVLVRWNDLLYEEDDEKSLAMARIVIDHNDT